jgi:hypothetical protein
VLLCATDALYLGLTARTGELERHHSRTSYEKLRQLLAQERGMAIHWWNLAIGFILGAILGAIGDWQIGARFRKRSELRALTRDYASLAGHYAHYRVREDGTHEPTGGTVEITWQPEDGLLEASGFHVTGNPEWHSYIKMSREYSGTGIGHYNNVNSIHGGIQQVIYSKQTRSFNVWGTTHTRKEFAHCWKPKE